MAKLGLISIMRAGEQSHNKVVIYVLSFLVNFV